MSATPQLPFNAQITPDPETKTRLLDNMNERFSKPRPEIHVSDLVYCNRQTVFRKLKPKPNTERELSYFSAGRGHHDVLEGLHGAEREVEREWSEIQAHYDLLDKTVLEVKTTRSFKRDIKAHWIRQLAYYCAIENQSVGKLIILYLFSQRATKKNPNPSPDLIETYTITFPDLDVIRRDLLQRRDLLIKALDAKNPVLAPGVRSDAENSWLCRNCSYKTECDASEAKTQ
jgi:CRISPR/Cas system-associated exonuclease Cas4 (RecB family)